MKFTAYQWVVMAGVVIAASAVVVSAVFSVLTYQAVLSLLQSLRIK